MSTTVILRSRRSPGEIAARAAFWTLWVIIVVGTLYALAVAGNGDGFLVDHPVPKVHMHVESKLAGGIAGLAGLMLLLLSIVIGRWSMTLRRLGLITFVFVLAYLAIPG